MRNQRKFPLSQQWRKLMIIQALWVWNTNYCLGTFWPRSGYLCRCRWAEQSFSFRVPTFPLMCVIIALTFPMGARRLITWHPPPPPPPHPPLFPQKPQPSSSPTPSLLWGSRDCLDMYLFSPLFVCDCWTSSLWLTFKTDDRWRGVGCSSGDTRPRLIPRRIRKYNRRRHRLMESI